MPIILGVCFLLAIAWVICWAFARSIAREAVWLEVEKARVRNTKLYFVVLAMMTIAGFMVGWWLGLFALVVGGLAFSVEQGQVVRFKKGQAEIALHARELAARKRRSCIPGPYGKIDSSAWEKEIAYFLERVIQPLIGRVDYASMLDTRLRAAIEAAAATPLSSAPGFAPTMQPIDYEAFVAEELERLGWSTRLTKGSGDQGVDVIATKGGRMAVIQCKLYSKPVGNSAVQEIIAGRGYEGADLAAVVSNAGFTQSAKRLAAAADVLLLHHDEMDRLSSSARVVKDT